VAAPDRAVARALAGDAPAGGERAAAATAALLGSPYVLSPLGEGFGRDPDPRFRLDAFDCMTFVETAVALGSASSLPEARAALDDVRYSGAPSFENRNHEVLSQWIPANLEKGWIAEATPRPPGGGPPTLAVKEYTRAGWEAVRAAGRALAGVPRSRLPLGRFEVPIVAPGEVAAVASLLPAGGIVFVVREDAPERATRITHAGLVVRGASGAVLVRHATSTKGVARVIEEPLERFLRREERAFPRWKVSGLAFFSIKDSTARVRSLARGSSEHEPQPASGAPPVSPAAGL
jgi:hypothetical protein